MIMRSWLIPFVPLASVIAVAAAETENAELADTIQRSVPHLTIAGVSPSEVTGVWEVQTIEQGAVFYVTRSGDFLFAGDLYAVSTDGLINLTEKRRIVRIRNLFDRLSPDDTIRYPATTENARVIHVFTDVDCTYCQQFHSHITELTARGIEVRYLGYPRDGVDSETYSKMVSAWCSPDPAAALTTLKSGESIEEASCDSPLSGHIELGRFIGIEGTPTIVTDKGERVPGYVPPQELLGRLGLPR